jgi:hypothetical protein
MVVKSEELQVDAKPCEERMSSSENDSTLDLQSIKNDIETFQGVESNILLAILGGGCSARAPLRNADSSRLRHGSEGPN